MYKSLNKLGQPVEDYSWTVESSFKYFWSENVFVIVINNPGCSSSVFFVMLESVFN